MSHHSLSIGEKRILVVLIAASVFCAATVLSSHGAVSAPLPPSADAQTKYQSDALMAQDSEWRRIEMGKIRYQKHMQHRADLLAGLHAELEKRQAGIALPPTQAQTSGADDTASAVTSATIWGILAIIGLLAFRHYWTRAAAKEKPKAIDPVKTVKTITSNRPAKTANTKTFTKPPAPVRRALDLDVIDLDQQIKGTR